LRICLILPFCAFLRLSFVLQATCYKGKADAEKQAAFKRLVRHTIQDDYFRMFDKLQQVPFNAVVHHPGDPTNGDTHSTTSTIKMTAFFTNLQADFLEACLQAMILQQGYLKFVKAAYIA
jgi:hypothetical protein